MRIELMTLALLAPRSKPTELQDLAKFVNEETAKIACNCD